MAGVVLVFKTLLGFVQFTVVNVGVIVMVGNTLSTFMVTLVVLVQPFAAVTVTLYVVCTVGVTLGDTPDNPLLQL